MVCKPGLAGQLWLILPSEHDSVIMAIDPVNLARLEPDLEAINLKEFVFLV